MSELPAGGETEKGVKVSRRASSLPPSLPPPLPLFFPRTTTPGVMSSGLHLSLTRLSLSPFHTSTQSFLTALQDFMASRPSSLPPSGPSSSSSSFFTLAETLQLINLRPVAPVEVHLVRREGGREGGREGERGMSSRTGKWGLFLCIAFQLLLTYSSLPPSLPPSLDHRGVRRASKRRGSGISVRAGDNTFGRGAGGGRGGGRGGRDGGRGTFDGRDGLNWEEEKRLWKSTRFTVCEQKEAREREERPAWALQIKVSERPVVFRHSSRVLLMEWPVAN